MARLASVLILDILKDNPAPSALNIDQGSLQIRSLHHGTRAIHCEVLLGANQSD